MPNIHLTNNIWNHQLTCNWFRPIISNCMTLFPKMYNYTYYSINNMVKTIINHPQNHHFYRCYKPFTPTFKNCSYWRRLVRSVAAALPPVVALTGCYIPWASPRYSASLRDHHLTGTMGAAEEPGKIWAKSLENGGNDEKMGIQQGTLGWNNLKIIIFSEKIWMCLLLFTGGLMISPVKI